ncbi:MAG: hypothetical protein ABSG26_15085 [Bryobacteraceae bacterium]|jgi:hypothetical protein
MKNSIPVLFTVTAGFAVAELSAGTVYRSTVLADPPMAYYLLGEAPDSPMAIDSSTNARDPVYEEISTLRVPKLNAPFTIEAWLQLTDDYDDSSEARGVLGGGAIQNYWPRPAQIGSPYQVETRLETLTLLGLALILFGLIPRGWRDSLKFRGGDAGLSHARIFQVGGVKLRRRSEAELNSFSACYATIAVQETPPAGCGVRVAFRRSQFQNHRCAAESAEPATTIPPC